MLMQPAQLHINVLSSLSAGILPIKIVGLPTTQGATVKGIQGIGVGTPKAAAVADITVGLTTLVHMAKGKTLSIATLSTIFAAGISTITLLVDSVTNVEGAVPNVQESKALPVTKNPITFPLNLRLYKTIDIHF